MADENLKVTMAEVWADIDPQDRAQLAALLNIPEGTLALMRIASVFTKVVLAYRWSLIAQQAAQAPYASTNAANYPFKSQTVWRNDNDLLYTANSPNQYTGYNTLSGFK
jgi:hypothetical protein